MGQVGDEVSLQLKLSRLKSDQLADGNSHTRPGLRHCIIYLVKGKLMRPEPGQLPQKFSH